MKILHLVGHLGGGVGKVHSVLTAASPPGTHRHYVLLERPRDPRFVEAVAAAGATVSIAPDFETIARLISEADIVQIEWWNHPRLFECLCRAELPPMRVVIWAHQSGLAAPYMPTNLFGTADSFFFTSACSFSARNVMALPVSVQRRIGVAPSGFGFERPKPKPDRLAQTAPPVAYLGTVGFSKLAPEFFEVIDAVEGHEFSVSMWGAADPNGPVVQHAAKMRNPHRVQFNGHTDNPEESLGGPGIFLYLLQPDHFGTGESALVEAMSLGWAPLVFANPAEAAIVRHGETGFVEQDAGAAARRLSWMLRNPAHVATIGERAAADISKLRSPQHLADTFDRSYRDVITREKRSVDFARSLGRTPAEWLLSTLTIGEQRAERVWFAKDAPTSKGSFNHFLSCFPGDPSLMALLRSQTEVEISREAGHSAREIGMDVHEALIPASA